MSKDYYKILGVEKNASAEEIRAAFRKLAHEYHPDKKGGNVEKFKEINEAYQVLSDPNKRQQYDQFGSAFESAGAGGFGGAGNGPFDFSNFAGQAGFEDLGDIFGGFSDLFGVGRKGGRGAKRGSDIAVDMEIDLAGSVFGVEKEISLYKTAACDVCGGSGAEPGSKITNCSQCGGRGQVESVSKTIFGSFRSIAVCPACGGSGKKAEKNCRHCSGTGVHKKEVELKLKIPAGINNGETIRVSGQGEAGKKGSAPGDLYITVHVKNDPRFVRKDWDLYMKANINFTEAALGDTISIDSLDGAIKLVIPEGTQSGQLIRVKGKGVTKLGGTGRGDLYVELVVVTPRKLTRRQKELLKELAKE